QAHERAIKTGRAWTFQRREAFGPKNDENSGKEELPQHEPGHVRLHVGLGPPQAHGGRVGALQPDAENEEVRCPDPDEHHDDGDNKAFRIHARRVPPPQTHGKRRLSFRSHLLTPAIQLEVEPISWRIFSLMALSIRISGGQPRLWPSPGSL